MMFDVQAVDARIAQLVKQQHLAGVSVCVKGKDGTIFSRQYGVRDLAMKTPVDADTVFGIASMSKSITSLALCILDAEGKLSVDDPVVKYIPSFRIPGTPRSAVTIRHLAMHTSGMPPMEPLEWSIAMNTNRRECPWLLEMRASAPNKMETIEQVIDYVAHCPYPTLGAPGEIMSYSNEGYAILSYVVDQAAHVKLEDFCRDRIFAPIGMTRTVMDDDCASAKAMANGDITSLFERENGETIGDDIWNILPPFRGCAMVKSTAPDMAAYYCCLANGGKVNGEQVIPAAAVERLVGAEYPETAHDYYCMGLNKFVRDGHVFLEHAGGLHGVSTKGAAIRDLGYGMAVLCNQGDEDMDDILWTLYSALLDMPLDTCFRRYQPNGEDFSDPEMMAGHFTGHEGSPEHLSVQVVDGKPVARKGETDMVLRCCGGTKFLGYTSETATSPCARLEFLIRNGETWGVRVGTRVFTRDHA